MPKMPPSMSRSRGWREGRIDAQPGVRAIVRQSLEHDKIEVRLKLVRPMAGPVFGVSRSSLPGKALPTEGSWQAVLVEDHLRVAL